MAAMKLRWHFVYLPVERGHQAIAAFNDRALAEGYVAAHPELNEVIVDRMILIGGDAHEPEALSLLRDIVTPDNQGGTDARMFRAIERAQELLGIPRT